MGRNARRRKKAKVAKQNHGAPFLGAIAPVANRQQRRRRFIPAMPGLMDLFRARQQQEAPAPEGKG